MDADTVTLDKASLDRLQTLADKQEIFDLSSTYMRGLDRLDLDLIKSTYHEDATDDRGFFQGSGWELADLAIGILAEHRVNHHILGQANIEIEGDVAFGEIYFIAYHRIIENGIEKDFIVGGRYIDRYEKRADTWKIAHRSELNDYCRTDPVSDDWLRQTPEALRGFRGADDLSYQKDKVRSL